MYITISFCFLKNSKANKMHVYPYHFNKFHELEPRIAFMILKLNFPVSQGIELRIEDRNVTLKCLINSVSLW